MFKKILVPLDGSDLAAQILPQVERLAKQFTAQVTLLAVGSSDTCPSGGAPPEAIKEGAACPEIPLARYLEQTTGKLRTQGVEVTWSINRGTLLRRSWPMRPGMEWTSSPSPHMAAAKSPGSWGAWLTKS